MSSHLESTIIGVSSKRRSNSQPAHALKCLHWSSSPALGNTVSFHAASIPAASSTAACADIAPPPRRPALPRLPPPPPPDLPRLSQFILALLSFFSSYAVCVRGMSKRRRKTAAKRGEEGEAGETERDRRGEGCKPLTEGSAVCTSVNCVSSEVDATVVKRAFNLFDYYGRASHDFSLLRKHIYLTCTTLVTVDYKTAVPLNSSARRSAQALAKMKPRRKPTP